MKSAYLIWTRSDFGEKWTFGTQSQHSRVDIRRGHGWSLRSLFKIHYSRTGFTGYSRWFEAGSAAILFAMNKDGNTYDKAFRKSAKSVQNIMGNYHPHGDSSIYEAMVRLSQDWNYGSLVIEMHGNNGSMDGDPLQPCDVPAAFPKVSEELLADIEKETRLSLELRWYGKRTDCFTGAFS